VDIRERLSFESASEHTLIACEHLHRYEFAAAICGGLRVLDLACGTGYGSAILADTAASVHGVDNDAATVELAATTVGTRANATFELADAIQVLRRDLAADFEAIVCFEGLEHLEAPGDAVAMLTEHAASGMRILLSVPNSKAFDEQNDFHVTDFDYGGAREVLAAIPDAVMLVQYLAEGSLISAEAEPAGLDARLVNIEQAEPEYANHFLLAANFAPSETLEVFRSRMQLNHAPVYNRYMRNLEGANSGLRFRNNELGRKLHAKSYATAAKADSAAAALLNKVTGRTKDLEDSVARLERDAARREEEHEVEIERLRAQLFDARLSLAIQPKRPSRR
jgi:2-polyprenyl-3-methyl-5-hydroxy-6-metoxy-1,4-benzoquinol methylase